MRMGSKFSGESAHGLGDQRVILCLFALTNLPWQLDDYDQAQQAFTSFR